MFIVTLVSETIFFEISLNNMLDVWVVQGVRVAETGTLCIHGFFICGSA